MTLPKSSTSAPPAGFQLRPSPLQILSMADDAGTANIGTSNSIQDPTKNWAINIWQGALLLFYEESQVELFVTIVSSNTLNTLTFPPLPGSIIIRQGTHYVLKRLPPNLYRPGVNLTATQTLKIFDLTFSAIPSLYPWVQSPLGPAASAHFVDFNTGSPTPFKVPKGYTFTFLQVEAAATRDAICWLYLDGFVGICAGMFAGGQTYYDSKVVGLSTTMFDPSASSDHTIDVIVTNLGSGSLQGTIDYAAILEKVS